jgi:tetratricopeptide (TPR) repeat protein/predicted  nucleic acid-binding Zn-ribbon protein
MLARIFTFPLAHAIGCFALLAVNGKTMAQSHAPAVGESAQFDPSDAYFQAYLSIRSSEELESRGDFAGAMEKLNRAQQLFGTIRKYYPEWKPEMIGTRSEKTGEAISRVSQKAQDQLDRNRNAVAELEGGSKQAVKSPEAVGRKPFEAPAIKVDPANAREISEAEAEVKRLRELSKRKEQESSRNSQQVDEMRRQNEALKAELNDAEETLQTLRGRLAEEVAKSSKPQSPIIKDDPATTQRLAAAEAEVRRLRELASQTPEQASREKSRADDMRRQNDALKAELRNAEANLQSMRAKLAAAPVESEVKSLNQRIESLEQERQAMSMALTQSRGSHTEALGRIATLEADLKALQQKRSDLDRDLKAEREVANSVVSGQRKQLDLLEKELEQKNSELTKANERIAGLSKELEESRQAFSQLRSEHDTLTQERDQMSALLKLNESGRIQDLIEQNMSLAKNLREANEKVEILSRENNADKDAYTDALRDLAIAKTQINNLQQEKREQDRRVAELEVRLKSEEAALAKGESNADPAETELLREIIKRQLRTQERRRQARELLVDAARELGTGDERISKAIEIFDTGEIALSPEEQKLIADRQVDGEFVSPFARDRATVSQATSELNRDISVFERTAEKSFVAGRLLPTRELYEMIIEQHPGHTPSLCKLGVVHLKLDDPMAAIDAFRRAVELEDNNAYAHRMLGFSFMRMGDIPAADKAIAKAVELAPNDAKSQLLLATLRYRLGRLGEAESHFKAAINADPMPSEPYYNLALLCSRDRRFEDARNYYQQALERGAQPDPKLEETIRKQ